MKERIKRQAEKFYRFPIIYSLSISAIAMLVFVVYAIIMDGSVKFNDIPSVMLVGGIISGFLIYPGVLTLLNIIFLFAKTDNDMKVTAGKKIEIVTIILGTIFTGLYINLMDIKFVSWDTVLKNNEKHFILSIDSLSGFIIPALIALAAYIFLRSKSIRNIPPLLAVFSISSLYLGIGICVIWIVQVCGKVACNPVLALAPFNFILILIKLIKEVITEWNAGEKIGEEAKKSGVEQTGRANAWKSKIDTLLKNSLNWPLLAFILTMPLLGIVVMISIIIGQKPDSIYSVWIDTADWNLSQKIAPPNEYFDQHYLCTVAVAGHPKLVKPIRPGTRGQETILVNRQLCIANAFEQLLEDKTPNFHRHLRGFYDKYGYPISKHINSPWRADVIYILMKPLEWTFLVVLYLFDVNPERRISRQYEYKGKAC